ncbi:pyruvate/2-oxoglutarate dehydrogenase complex, dihydrolipoamide dehydrogenase component [SAR116 cluster alpha proteobacterium HIMB100]|nr:pyruvate/2-oxoglutarate dehydrogenase complex, dihydrolipoamide dehydrogenase component [SAR116 cluster alpha proteobacterium HIMB100]
MTDVLNTDICIIGAGSGGLSVAAGAVQMGADVVLLERAEMGGDCLNTGCVPSKALLAAGKAAKAARGTPAMGITASEDPLIDFAAVKAHVADVIAGIAPHDSVERFTDLGVTVIQAEARFASAHKVIAETTTGTTEICARYFVIATGSHPWAPPIEGLTDVPVYTNETIFELQEKPDHLLVIGGGPIGIEMAQAHRRLGCKVTVVEAFSIMGRDDAELVSRLKKRLEDEQIILIENTQITSVSKLNGQICIDLADGHSVKGSHLLVAIGRRPNIESLHLDAGRIAYTAKGITTDEWLRTSQKHIFAIGDVAGRHQFTHVAGYHAGIVIRNMLFRLPAKLNHDAIPWVTYTDPELGHVGLSWAEAVDRYTEAGLRRVDWELAENDRARAERRTEGMIRVITTKKGRIVGASILAPHAGEMIHVWALAITKKMNISAMAGTIAPYPSWSEASKRAAGAYFTDSLFSTRTRNVVKFLLKFTQRKG